MFKAYKLFFRFILLVVALLIAGAFLFSCSPLNKLRKQLKAHPEWVDSLKVIQHDTVTVTGIKDSVVEKKVVDSAMVRKLAAELVAALPKDQPEIIREIADAVCPEVSKDSTYHIRASNSEFSLYIPIRVRVKAKGSKLSYTIDAPEIKLPETRVVTVVQIKETPEKFYKNKFFWLAIVLLLLVIALILRR